MRRPETPLIHVSESQRKPALLPDVEPPPRLRSQYVPGRSVAEEFHQFSFPRTGAHYFLHCLNGLYDLVTFPHEYLNHEEAISRQDELNLPAHYALDLREEGSAYSPIFLNANAAGVHGLPFLSEKRRIILLRHPIPTLYSLQRVSRERWGAVEQDAEAWLERTIREYLRYYETAFEVCAADPVNTLMVRFEDNVASPAELTRIVRFVGRNPKLSPRFVHWITGFERLVRQDPGSIRTFYRAGRPDSYKEDEKWRTLFGTLDPARWAFLGYKATPT